MAKLLIIFLLCLSSVYSDSEMKVDVPKDEVLEKVDDTSTSVKSKRYSVWPSHPTPCPPNSPHYHQGWNMPAYQKVNFIRPHYVPKPAVTIIKPNQLKAIGSAIDHMPKVFQCYPRDECKKLERTGCVFQDLKSKSISQNLGKNMNHTFHLYFWTKGWNPWQQNQGWSKPSYGYPMTGWNNGWQSPSVQPVWKPPVIQAGWKPTYSSWNKPAYSYAPSYDHKPSYHVPIHNDWVKPHQPECPPWEHSHTGIVYAPQHQYHHQPQIVKVAKPVYQHPQYQYHHQPQIVKLVKPLYHHPQPVYHHTPSFHHPVHHLPQHEPCD